MIHAEVSGAPAIIPAIAVFVEENGDLWWRGGLLSGDLRRGEREEREQWSAER
jgi:hypothetical protein